MNVLCLQTELVHSLQIAFSFTIITHISLYVASEEEKEFLFLSIGQLKALSPAWTALRKGGSVEECWSSQSMASGHKGTQEP